ncbi:MAG: transcription antitermination factor NusB [Eubacterium sp.]
MTRFEQREQALFLIFESMFSGNDYREGVALYEESNGKLGEYAKFLFDGVSGVAEELDDIISQHSNGWKISRLPKVNVAILRLAIYELLHVDDVPDSVAINEAVELTKKYSGTEDASFVNGILGAVFRSKN